MHFVNFRNISDFLRLGWLRQQGDAESSTYVTRRLVFSVIVPRHGPVVNGDFGELILRNIKKLEIILNKVNAARC